MTLTRKEKTEEIPYGFYPPNIDMYPEALLTGTTEQVINRLREIERYAVQYGYRDIRFKLEESWNDLDLQVWGTRDETEKEYRDRVRASNAAKKSAAKRKEKEREARRKQYEKLKKEFEVE